MEEVQATQPLAEQPLPEETVAEVEVKEVEKKPAKKKAVEVVEPEKEASDIEDRSAYNCPDCKGEGLNNQNQRCNNCGGTGKIN